MNKIIEEVKSQTSDDKKEFVNTFIDNVVDSNTMISFTKVYEWIGYKKKETVLLLLRNKKFGFIEGEKGDFFVKKIKVDNVCKPINEIFMTIDTVKSICLMAPTEKGQQFRKYYIELEKCFKKLIAENINLQTDIKLINPMHILNKFDFDVNLYKGKEVVYLICIMGEIYKFGVTQNILKRLKTHKDNLNYVYVLKCWNSINRTVSKKIEDCIKLYIRHAKIDHRHNNETEVFKTDNINSVIEVINKYVEKYTKEYNDQFKNAKLEQKNELIKNKLELFKLLKEYDGDKNTICKTLNVSKSDIDNTLLKINDKQCIKPNNIIDNILKNDSDDNSDNDSILNSDNDSDCDSDNDSLFDHFNKPENNDDNNDKEQSQEQKDFNMKTDLRKCQRCKGPYTEDEFGLNQKKKPYKNCSSCREKQLISDLKRKDNPKRIENKKEGMKKYMEIHREEINKKKNEEYKKSHPPKIRQTVEERQAKEKEYYAKNRDKILQYKKKFYYGTKPDIQNKEDIDPINDIMKSIDENDLLRQKQNKYYDENASEIIYRKTMRARTNKNNNINEKCIVDIC